MYLRNKGNRLNVCITYHIVRFFGIRCLLFSLSAPLIISATIVVLCLICSFIRRRIFSDPWCILIFLIIFFGGLLVLFVYVSALAHNEILAPNIPRLIFLLPIFGFSFSSTPRRAPWRSLHPAAVHLFNLNLYSISIGLITYLLLALLIVSHITFFHFGALREASVNPFKEIPPFVKSSQ